MSIFLSTLTWLLTSELTIPLAAAVSKIVHRKDNYTRDDHNDAYNAI